MSAPERAPTHLTGVGDVPLQRCRTVDTSTPRGAPGRRQARGRPPAAARRGDRRSRRNPARRALRAGRHDRGVRSMPSRRWKRRLPPSSPCRQRQRQDGAPLRVRMALHTGEGTSGDGRYRLGQTLDRGAAICAVGHGGQLLLSAATAARCSDHLPREVTMRDAGWHRLRDLGKPEHVFELDHPRLLSSFPPLQTLDTYRHNLPVQLTPLVGRWREIVAVCGALASDRLLTLTGAAGVGKTRLALAVAAGVLDDFPGGVWWVDLAPLADPDAVIRSALSALGARQLPGAVRARQLAAELGDEPALVVLDNCEHLAEACAGLVAELMTEAPDRLGAHHQPRATGRLRRGHLAGALDAVSWRRGPHRPCGAVSVRSHRPVRRPRTSSSTGLRGHGTTMLRPSPRPAGASTGSPWPSSWPPPGAGSCPPSA